MKHLALPFALLLVLSGFSATTAQPLPAEREQLLQNLRKHQDAVNQEIDVYAGKAATDPENEGAKTLLRLLRNVADGIDLYMDNELVNDSLKKRSVRAWEAAKRYSTESAQQTARVLSRLVELSSRVPRHFRPVKEARAAAQADTAPAGETAAATSKEASEASSAPELDYGPDLAASAKPADPPAEPPAGAAGEETPFALQENMFLLFGATVLILIGLGGVLLWRLRKQKAALMHQMADLQRRMENIGVVGENTGRASEVKQTQWQRKVEALESNMADFLEQVDERVNQTQLIADKLSATSKKQMDQLEGLEAKVNELLPLQDRLRLLEEKVKQMSVHQANGSAALPNKVHTEQLNGTLPFLIQNLEALKSRTRQDVLRNRIEELLPGLQRVYKERSSDSLDVDTLAKVIQLAYVSARNEGLRDNFENLKQAARKLGIQVEDQMDGRMGFSEFYAENLHLDEYLHGPNLHGGVMPAPERVREEVENSPQWQEGVKGTVLYTLLPAVVQQAEGTKRPLAKGTYIVQP